MTQYIPQRSPRFHHIPWFFLQFFLLHHVLTGGETPRGLTRGPFTATLSGEEGSLATLTPTRGGGALGKTGSR